MSSTDLALFLNGLGSAAPKRAGVLRVVLLSGDTLRIPRSSRHLRVLSGTAWISQCGKDTVLESGQCYRIRGAADCAVISGLRGEPLLVEVR